MIEHSDCIDAGLDMAVAVEVQPIGMQCVSWSCKAMSGWGCSCGWVVVVVVVVVVAVVPCGGG